MTKEEQQKDDIETMKILFNADINELCNQRRFNDAREMEGIRDRIIQALEQQPSEDCISRQAVLDYAKDTCLDLDKHEDTEVFCDEIKALPSVTPTNEAIKEAYLKGYDYGVKDWFKSKTQPCENAVILNVTSEGCWREEEEYSCGLKSKKIWWDDGIVAEREDEE